MKKDEKLIVAVVEKMQSNIAEIDKKIWSRLEASQLEARALEQEVFELRKRLAAIRWGLGLEPESHEDTT